MPVRFTVPVAIAALLAVAVPAVASQQRVNKWWASEAVRSELGLSADQAAEIEQVFQATLPRLRQIKKELDVHQAALSRLLADRSTNEAQMVQAIERVETTRSELSKTRTLMLFKMHRLLTAEQLVRLEVLNKRWESERDARREGRP
jgi:hypothetical protein